MKKNNLKNNSNNKVAQYRYAEDDKENINPSINNIFQNIGNIHKIQIISNSDFKEKSFADKIVNQKLNFEVINENSLNGILNQIKIKNKFE